MRQAIPAEASEQLERILASNAFRNCGSLRKLLEYLGERALAGEGDDVKEYRIGVEGLGRPESYDPRTDPSVRVQVGRLRARLAEYYLDEGRDDPLLITLPKGAFSLSFEERPASGVFAATADAAQPSVPSVPAAPPRPPLRTLYITSAAAILIAGLLGFFAASGTGEAADTPLAQETEFDIFWRPYLKSEKPVLIALGVPLWLHFEKRDAGGQIVSGTLRDIDLNEWSQAESHPAGQRVAAWKERLQADTVTPSYHYLAVGESIAAFLVGKALATHGKDSSVVRSNVLSWDAAKAGNVIFIGAPKFNPHLRNVNFSRNFQIGRASVLNLNPRSGEATSYPQGPVQSASPAAALIGRYPSPGGGGWLTIIGSANSMGTWAAIEYLTRPEYVATLTRALREEFGKLPDSFEAVIEARFDQENPIEVHHVALREVVEPSLASARSSRQAAEK